jgi:hypothetical protein
MRRRDRISVAIGGASLVTAVLAVGGVFRWSQALVAALVGGALVPQITSRRKLDRLSPILVLIGLATIVTALQLVPLPGAVLDVLQPVGNTLRDDGAALASTHPWPCLSLDPAGTVRALVFFMTLFGIAVLGLRIAASERGRYVLIGGVAITCGLAAAVTGLHMIVNADELYGLYAPVHAAPPILGPLLNPNHLGCLMAFGATISVGLTFYGKQKPAWRALWVVTGVGCAVIALASESRGAAVSLALGMAITSGILIGRGLGEASRHRGRAFKQLPIALVVALGFGLAVYASAGDVADQLDRTSITDVAHPTSKFAAWKASVALVGESPWVGVGRGAVEPTFTRVFDASAFVTFSHLENEYVSAIVEWGVPAAFLLALALAWCTIGAIRRWREGPLAAAALGGLVGVAFQSSVDFGIQLLGVAVPVTIVACTLQTVPVRETSRLRGLRIRRIAVVAALVVGALLVMRPAARSLQEDHDDVVQTRTPPLGTLLAMIERHPLDYFAFGKASEQLLAAGDPRGVAFLNQAMLLHPFSPGLHRLAARMLIAAGRIPQATVEYGLAMNGTAHPHPLLTEIVATLPRAEDAAASIPVGYFSPEAILKSLTELKREDVAERWLARVRDAGTHDLALVDELYALAMARGDLDVALATAAYRLHEANTETSRLMHAQVQFARKDYDAVQRELSDLPTWHGRIDERGTAGLLVCDTYSAREQWDQALECISRLDATGMMGARQDEVLRRERDIADHRAAERKLREIQELERKMNLPVDTYIPVLHEAPPPPVRKGPSGTITNPLRGSTTPGHP